MKIFLIDDDEQILHGLAETLKPTGYECKFSADPRKAIEILEKDKFDVLITDYRMPGMNGLEILKYVNEQKLTRYLIMMSGYIEANNISESLGNSVFAFFKKPVNVQDLINVLEKINKEIKNT